MNVWLVVAALNGAMAVAAGAFAAHGLEARLDAHAHEIFETGARYHMYHAFAIALAALAMRGPAAEFARYAAVLFLAGIVFFSGSLYVVALSHWRSAAFITPMGGLFFLAGWILLAWAGWKVRI